MGEMVTFPTPNGGKGSAYLAKAKAGAPGVVVIQEWWGLNDQIKKTGDRFAAAGFNALVPDLYKGRVAKDPDEANHLMTGLDWVGATEQDIRGAVQYLKQAGSTKVAVLGFCMGGALTIIASVKVKEADAGVCFYGIPPVEAADPKKIRVPFQAHFASQDDWCTPAAVNGLEATLKAAKIKADIHRYAAQHGFFNEQRPDVYNAAAAKTAWDRTQTFLKAHL
ncbi:MAG: dienelactone hydrolase family protein [Candidatus Lambdaproteobacteria bacterium]|nr:dienelactone hydrolase family protein [Candidatus Lambdaproteobacteria bacterium]